VFERSAPLTTSTDEEYYRFLKRTPAVEKAILDDDIILIKYWFEVSQEVQCERLEKRIEDPRKHRKLSPMDLEAQELWEKYSKAKDKMFLATDSKHAPGSSSTQTIKRVSRLPPRAYLAKPFPIH
jgi:polyphosphate kinase 2 (PPK2 family)